jgi:diguanylate cyclase (GGDEF)-like protein
MGGPLHCLGQEQLERFLERRRSATGITYEFNLGEQLLEVLRRANDFVPSAAGSLLLDDPTQKQEEARQNRLTFVAAFGDKASMLVGRDIPADRGIAGHVYVSGEAYRSADAHSDRFFYPGVDLETRYRTESLLAVPVRIGETVCGVLELLNREGGADFSEHDLKLLDIFAGYIAISIQNVLDGRQAHEIARRDNLTGLFNDRYLHIALQEAIDAARSTHRDLAVLFLDLDFFKRINDTHGHLAGSQVLREVGALLAEMQDQTQRQGREQWLVARYGGDEFVIAVPGRSLTAAVTLAERIRLAIVGRPFCNGGDILAEPLRLTGLTCSIGIATLKRHVTADAQPDQAKTLLLRLADAAMYIAKETGRNQTAVAGTPVRRTI